MGKIRVMIVEDDKELAWPHIYNKAFPTDDIEVVMGFCTMPDDWLDVDLSEIDVVLMDGTVSKKDDGYPAIKVLKAIKPELKIIVASYMPEIAKAKEVGADETWTKRIHSAVSLQNLVRAVANV